MVYKAIRLNMALAVFAPLMEIMNSFDENSFLSSRTKSRAIIVPTADETPGSHATNEPAAVPVNIPRMIVLRGRKNLHPFCCGGISDFVIRLITSIEAPNIPDRSGRRMEG